MSSRRAVGEDNILAMLERDSARRTGSRMSTLRLAWYGTAAAFAGILAGGVAWLAYDNHKTTEQMQAEQDALAAVPPVISSAATPPAPAPMLTAPPPDEAPRAAVIVDEPAPAPRPSIAAAPAAPGSSLPPLVMLPRQDAPREAAPARMAAQPAPRVTRSSAVPPLVMLPREAVAARAEARPAKRTPKESAGEGRSKPRAVQVAARSGSEKKVGKTQVTGINSAKAAPKRSINKTADAPRQRKSGGATPQVDSDVALISAIIAQSERHRGEREAAAACGGEKCLPKPSTP